MKSGGILYRRKFYLDTENMVLKYTGSEKRLRKKNTSCKYSDYREGGWGVKSRGILYRRKFYLDTENMVLKYTGSEKRLRKKNTSCKYSDYREGGGV